MGLWGVFAIVLLATVMLASGVYMAGRRLPGYQHRRDTISELGAVGTEFSRRISLGLFLPVAVALLLAAWRMWGWATPQVAGLAGCLGLGYLIAALVPCERGAPVIGGWRTAIHNAGGAIEYLGGAMMLWLYAGPSRAELSDVAAIYAAALVMVGTVAISIPTASAWRWRGLIQRVIEAVLFVALLSMVADEAAVDQAFRAAVQQ